VTSQLYKNKSAGYVALISILLIAFVLLTISVTVGVSGFWGRFSQLDYENKRISASLAEACVEVAVLDLASGTPTFPKTVPIGTLSCEICKIENPAGDPTILVRAVHRNSYTNLDVDFAKVGSKLVTTGWDEIVNYEIAHPSDPCPLP